MSLAATFPYSDMTKQVVLSEEAHPPLPIYCKLSSHLSDPNSTYLYHALAQAIISGKTIYVSGSIGITRDMKLVEGGVQAQTVRSLFLSALGTTLMCLRHSHTSVPLSTT